MFDLKKNIKAWKRANGKGYGLFLSLPCEKGIEIEADLDEKPWQLFRLNVSATKDTDHAGVKAGLGFLNFRLDANFYDGRHWNDKEGRYYEHLEEMAELDDDKRKLKELNSFLVEENAATVLEKLKSYLRYISISDRAHLHEHIFSQHEI